MILNGHEWMEINISRPERRIKNKIFHTFCLYSLAQTIVL